VGEVEALNVLEGREQILVSTDIRAAVSKFGDQRPLSGNQPLAFLDMFLRAIEPAP
jgi:hypothetical protein